MILATIMFQYSFEIKTNNLAIQAALAKISDKVLIFFYICGNYTENEAKRLPSHLLTLRQNLLTLA